MLTKLDIRRLIEHKKEEYEISGDKTLYVNVAILKGLYIALGGKKYITLPQKFDGITAYSNIVFKHKLNTKTKMTKDKITSSLIRSLIEIGKNPEAILKKSIPITNIDIANFLVSLILSDYTEDMIINSMNIQNITLELLDSLD